jgi:hypothetical protein
MISHLALYDVDVMRLYRLLGAVISFTLLDASEEYLAFQISDGLAKTEHLNMATYTLYLLLMRVILGVLTV